LARICGFWTSNAAAFPESSKGGKTFARVAKAVAEIDANVIAKQLAAHEGRRAKSAARTAVRRWMIAIARSARDLTFATPALEKTLRMPAGRSEVALLGAAGTFLEAAGRVETQLIDLGLPTNFLTQFREAVATFEQQLGRRREGRGAVAQAQQALRAAFTDGMNAARTLDVIVTNTLGHDPALLARWQRDRRLVDGRKARAAVMTTAPSSGAEVAADMPSPHEDASAVATPQPASGSVALVPSPSIVDSLGKAS
jgi:hypothetical protein